MIKKITTFAIDSMAALLTLIRICRVPPMLIAQQPKHLNLNVGALIPATVLYFVVRGIGVKGEQSFHSDLFDSFFINLSYAIFLLISAFLIIYLFDNANIKKERANKVISYIIFVWVYSLLFMLIDILIGIPSWTNGLNTRFVVAVFFSDHYLHLALSLIFSIFGALAAVLRTKIASGQLGEIRPVAVWFVIGTLANSTLLYLTVYGHLWN